MGHYFLADLTQDLSGGPDIVQTWLPLLRQAIENEHAENSLALKIGSTSIAALGVAAVEQRAKSGELKRGTVNDLRRRALGIYQTAHSQIIYEKAQIRILEMLIEQKPELQNWTEQVQNEIRGQVQVIWRLVATHTIQILDQINGQKFRKGHKGRLEVFNGKGMKPAFQYRGYIDADVIKLAIGGLSPSMKTDSVAIRCNVRANVKDFIIKGILPSGTGTTAEAVDTNCKRIFRKIPIFLQLSRGTK
jgi:hypothetical protein